MSPEEERMPSRGSQRGGRRQAATARSLAPVARAYSAAQRSAIRDWRDASTPTTTRDVDPVDMPIHRFRDISHHASVIPRTTLLRLARNGQGRKSPNLSCSRGLQTPANQVIFGESIRVPLTEVDDCGHTEYRRGRSKRSYGHCRRRTEIPEAERPTGRVEAAQTWHKHGSRRSVAGSIYGHRGLAF